MIARSRRLFAGGDYSLPEAVRHPKLFATRGYSLPEAIRLVGLLSPRGDCSLQTTVAAGDHLSPKLIAPRNYLFWKTACSKELPTLAGQVWEFSKNVRLPKGPFAESARLLEASVGEVCSLSGTRPVPVGPASYQEVSGERLERSPCSAGLSP